MSETATEKIGLLARFRAGFAAFTGIEQRSTNPSINFSTFASQSESGTNVNSESMLRLSAAYSSIRNISEDIGKIPFSIYDKEGTYDNIEQTNHAAYKLLRFESSPGIPSYVLKASLIASALSKGDGFAYIRKDKKGIPNALFYIPYENVEILISEKTNEIIYRISGTNKNAIYVKSGDYKSTEMIHVRGLSLDGVRGVSVISYGANSLGLAISAQNMASKVYKNGSNIGGFLQTDNVLKPEQIKNLQNSFNASTSGNDNAYKWKLLDAGIKANPIDLKIEDTQLLETRQFSIADVARWFRMPLHKIQDMSGATFSNIEQQNIVYATDTLNPWVSKLEDEFLIKLCTEKEIASGYFVRGNLGEILRGDTAARTQYYKEMTYIGAISTNEVRSGEMLNSVNGGENRYIPSNMMVIKEDGSIYVPNINPNNQPKD